MQPQPQSDFVRVLIAFSDNPFFGAVIGLGVIMIVASTLATFGEKVLSPIYNWLFKPLLPEAKPPPQVYHGRLNELLEVMIYDRILDDQLLESRVAELDKKLDQLLKSMEIENNENPK